MERMLEQLKDLCDRHELYVEPAELPKLLGIMLGILWQRADKLDLFFSALPFLDRDKENEQNS